MMRQRGQTLPMIAAFVAAAAVLLLFLISLGTILMSWSNAKDALRDAARAAALTVGERDGTLYLDQGEAVDAAQQVFYQGIDQMSGWIDGPPESMPLSVEVLNPPAGSCAPFSGGGTCYWRPAVKLRTQIRVRVVLGTWGVVPFDLETVVVSGVGDPFVAPTPAPSPTDVPVPTQVIDITAVP